jgi:fibronectin type 3 domain-containing protein
MSKFRAHLDALRSFTVVGCLALLAACVPDPISPPDTAPTGLVATGGNAQVTLAWSAASDAKGYTIKRATSPGGGYTVVAAVNALTYTDTTVTNYITYYYVVSAFNDGGEGPNSTAASTTPAVPAIPLAPANLTAAAGDGQAVLNWSISVGAAEYRLKRSATSGGPYTQIATTTVPTYTDTPLTNGNAYYYVVSAANTLGESPNSTQAIAVPSPPPPSTFGTWTNVTPSGVDLTSALCSNFGTNTVQVDPTHAGHVYTQFHCQGIWKSTDYGQTWTGPLNPGAGNATSRDCSGGITISPVNATTAPILYQACIRGTGTGFWKSVNGGVTWTNYNVAPGGARQDYYPPVVDPYDPNHLLMSGHEFDSLVQSTDGGQTWTAVNLDNGMLTGGKSGFIAFINTGNATTTRNTWLWIGQESGGVQGTRRTTNGGTTWVKVDKNEQPIGLSQVYQPGTNGVLFMAGQFSDLGRGILRSMDYGQTWSHVGLDRVQAVVIGTAKNTYGMYSFPFGAATNYDPLFQVASQPGTGTWVSPASATATLTQGAAQLATVNDGTHNVLIGAMWNRGVWRYVEP